MKDSVASNIMRSLRSMLELQGFKSSFSFTEVEGKGSGFLVSIFDPVEPDSVFFCRFYTLDELKIIVTAQRIFWRFFK